MFPAGVVAYDRAFIVPDGTVIEGVSNVRRYLLDGRAVVLPYDEDLAGARFAGYVRAGWGEGRTIESAAGERICPMLLRAHPDRPWLYWAAVVEGSRPGASCEVRLLPNPGEGDSWVSLAATDGSAAARAPLYPGKVTVLRGRRAVSAIDPGWLALDFHVSGSGARMLVTAVSQSRIDASG